MTREGYETELELLRTRTPPDEFACAGGVPVRIDARVPPGRGGAHEALRRVIEVLESVIVVRAADKWPAEKTWASSLLPRWFVDACSPEMSKEETAEWLGRWRAADRNTRARMERAKGWSMAQWLHWFAPGPDERQWRWAGAVVEDDEKLQVHVCVEGSPFASGALAWLLQVAGAESVTVAD